MLRVWLAAAWIITAGCALLIGVIYSQPQDDAALRTFFVPPVDCAAPCWLGVRPGITPVTEAIRLLEAHEWIDRVERSSAFYDLIWSGRQPDWIDSSFRSHFRAAGDTVENIRIRTTLSVGRVFILLGRPQTGVLNAPLNQAGLRHTAIYNQNGAEINSLTLCPITRRSLWHTPVEIQYRDLSVLYSAYAYNLADWLALRPCR